MRNFRLESPSEVEETAPTQKSKLANLDVKVGPHPACLLVRGTQTAPPNRNHAADQRNKEAQKKVRRDKKGALQEARPPAAKP